LAWATAATWYLIFGVGVNVACVLNGRRLRRRHVELGETEALGAVLAIMPTIGEQTLEESLGSLLCASHHSSVHVVVVSHNSKDRIAHRVATVAARHPKVNVRHHVSEGTNAAKPFLLNDVLAHANRDEGAVDLVVMVDCDTVVEPDLFEILLAARPTVLAGPGLLQPLVLSRPMQDAGPLGWVEAVMHSRWRLGYEVTLQELGARLAARSRRFPLTYAVGCCVAIDGRYAYTHGFPLGTEDLDLGYMATWEGHPITPAPTTTLTRSKQGPVQNARRNAAWYDHSIEALARLWSNGGGHSRRLLVAFERLRLLAWVPGPPILAGSAVFQYAMASETKARRRLGWLVVLMATTYLSALPALVLARVPPAALPAGTRRRTLVTIMCPIRPLWSNFGALLVRCRHR
jgi:hypothetical protein